MKVIRSIYTQVFEHNNIYYLYNAQTGLFCEITPLFYNLIKSEDFGSLNEEEIKELVSKKILVEENAKYDYYHMRQLMTNLKKYDNTSLCLVLVPTTACNFKCPYCFEPKANPLVMNEQVISDIMTSIKKRENLQSLSIIWYGGEPLLALDKIERILNGLSCEGMPKLDHHSIITNGYLFTDKAIALFKKYPLENIQITIDGSENFHNKTRCLANGAPTYSTILSNLKKILCELSETNVQIRVNVNKNNWEEYIRLNEDLASLLKKYNRLSMYPGLIREDSEDGKSLCSSSFSCSDVMNLYNLFNENGIDISLFPRRTDKGCMMQSANSFIIGPEGELYKCWNDVSIPEKVVGNISTATMVHSSLYFKYMIDTIPFNDECKECAVFPLCNGGCGLDRYRNVHEGGKYPVCTTFKNPENLKNSLLKKDPLLNVKE